MKTIKHLEEFYVAYKEEMIHYWRSPTMGIKMIFMKI
jgi:hypothetical protein